MIALWEMEQHEPEPIGVVQKISLSQPLIADLQAHHVRGSCSNREQMRF